MIKGGRDPRERQRRWVDMSPEAIGNLVKAGDFKKAGVLQ
jgi:replication-associated recombination protein RarA